MRQRSEGSQGKKRAGSLQAGDRQARLAQAMRANLRRRKEQQRERSAVDEPVPPCAEPVEDGEAIP